MDKNEIPIGHIKTPYSSYSQLCTVTVTLKDTPKGKTLSICGSMWNKPRTDITEGGQMHGTIEEALHNTQHNKTRPYFTKFHKPYTEVKQLITTWKRWHLNDMRAGCEHQRAEDWGSETLLLKKSITNLAMWVTPQEHPKGVLTKPCPICGYKYGTAWLHEPLPNEVTEWIQQFAGVQLEVS